jgi:hypothetical protein
MTPQEIEALIDHKIALHERRIGWISGIAGAVFMAALFFLQ